MQLAVIDIIIIGLYMALSVGIGVWLSRKASQNIRTYFLGGNQLPWYYLGLSNASGQFDVGGTMWMIYLLFIYGLKSVYIPWLWPAFNQIFLMVFLSLWLRRSNVMTGAEWISFRFGNSRGAEFAHQVIVVFALLVVLGYLAYSFVGAGKFAAGIMPWQLSADPHTNEIFYGLILTAITTVYVVKGGMFGVVLTEVVQFFIMTVACIAIGVIAMMQVSPEMLSAAVPEGWSSMAVTHTLDLDWSGILDSANQKIINDGWSLFSVFFMLVLLKGILQSLAGPAPNYDMQRILSARTPVEAAKMSGVVSLVLLFPRYMMITGLTVLALVFFAEDLRAMGPDVDFEAILPFALANYVPAGLLGLVLAGLLATFMSTFAATVNAAPAYVVNDVYKRYINPDASQKTYVRLSYAVSLFFVVLGTVIGLFVPSLNDFILWMVSALYGGYTAANILKWYWWRFNGVGYCLGMLAGIVAAIPLMFTDVSPLYAFPFLFAFCLLASVLAALLSKPDDMDVLKQFYLKTRPWGFWAPVHTALEQEQPGIRRNTDFVRDMVNCAVGLVWHTALTAAPIFLVIKHWPEFFVAVAVIACATIYLYLNWYRHLKNTPEDAPAEQNDVALSAAR
ncbi:sodium:solute symporter family protein [Simiduia agarivorans]|uniref:Na+/solute symporter n=1 Tax=Simiduia agarivorans (strain DSM 21679 / JCM 13881 / BCRC 17597 / SA1) TaxID=1117647 RepID=K4KQD9_SIMAS|nr:sodium:solute symporter family protein [Simiduia agarivorans]AFV00486.1 Na+/solute symporter [Simiduia agarivorans SA1 = DSM 21679]